MAQTTPTRHGPTVREVEQLAALLDKLTAEANQVAHMAGFQEGRFARGQAMAYIYAAGLVRRLVR